MIWPDPSKGTVKSVESVKDAKSKDSPSIKGESSPASPSSSPKGSPRAKDKTPRKDSAKKSLNKSTGSTHSKAGDKR